MISFNFQRKLNVLDVLKEKIIILYYFDFLWLQVISYKVMLLHEYE